MDLGSLGYSGASRSPDNYTSNGWGCLQPNSQTSSSLLDGTVSPVGNWYYAVGTHYCWGTSGSCYPGPTGDVPNVELWVR